MPFQESSHQNEIQPQTKKKEQKEINPDLRETPHKKRKKEKKRKQSRE